MSQPTTLDSITRDDEDNSREFLVTVSPDTEELIDTLSRQTGKSPGHVLLWGALLYKVVWDAKGQGKRLGIVGPDGMLETEIGI